MGAFWGLFFLITWAYGMYCLGRLAYQKSARWRHWRVNHVEIRKAAVLDDLDRQLQDDEHKLWPEKTFEHQDCLVCGPGPLLQGVVPSLYEHPFFNKEREARNDGYGSWMVEVLRAASPDYATMVSSQVIQTGKYTGKHTLMLDIDLPATLIQSTTAGHYHLYIDCLMSWREYCRVLKAMEGAGLIEHGYYRAARRQGATMLRPPWVKKPFDPPNMGGKPSGKRWDHRWARGKQKNS